MTNPQPQPFTRRYPTDAHYQADALSLAQAGWRVVSVQREPTGAIVATYASAASTASTALPRSSSIWKRATQDRNAFVIAGSIIGGALVFALLLALLSTAMRGVGAAGGGATASVASGGAQATSAAFSAALDATATANAALATATPQVARVSGPHLGAPLSDFDVAFGPEVSQGFWDTTIASQHVQLAISGTREGDSVDGQDRSVIIDISGADMHHAWTSAQENAIVTPFLPPDATHTHDVAGWDTLGPDHIFTSLQLANSLMPGVFQDANNQNLALGTLDWQCSTNQQFCEVGV